MGQDYFTDKELAGDAASSVLGIAKSAVVSTLADTASTIWNSTLGNLGADKVTTRDILRTVDQDSLAFYNVHKEGVEAASFLGGMIAPQLVTLKLLNMAKRGETALGMSNAAAQIFTGKKATILEEEIGALFSAAKYDTATYNATMRALYRTKAAESLIDSAILEASMVGTLNAHPYMEDYMQSPVSSFALWTAVGGGVGAGFGVIAANAAKTRIEGKIATKALDEIQQGKTVLKDSEFGFDEVTIPGYKDPSTAASNVVKYQQEVENLRNLGELRAQATNKYTEFLVDDYILKATAKRDKALQDVAPFLFKDEKGIKTLIEGNEQLLKYVEEAIAKPEFIGVDRIGTANLKGVNVGIKRLTELDLKELEFFTDGKKNPVFYRPSTDEFFLKDDINAVGLVTDIKGYKPKNFANNKNDLTEPYTDFAISNVSRKVSSALADARYFDELSIMKDMKPEFLKYVAIAENDLPRMNALLTWASKQDDVTGLKFTITGERAAFGAAQEFIKKASGLSRSYETDLNRLTLSSKLNYANYGFSGTKYVDGVVLSPTAADALKLWINGSYTFKQQLRAAMSDYLTTPQKDLHKLTKPLDLAAKELWEKGEAYREAIRKISVKEDGKDVVYLYRGATQELNMHASIESYATSPSVAKGFGDTKLFKIPVDNIIGAVGNAEKEILVTSRHYDTVTKLPLSGKSGETVEVLLSKTKTSNEVSLGELADTFHRERIRQAMSMFKDEETKFSIQEVAARLNMDKTSATLIHDLGDSVEPGYIFRRYNSFEALPSYIAPENKMLVLRGNPNAFSMVDAKASLDKRNLEVTDRMIINLVTEKHNNPMANAVRDIYAPADANTASAMRSMLDHLRDMSGELNNHVVGSSFYQSVDNALRHANRELNGISNSMLIPFIGKQFQDATDRMVKYMAERIVPSMRNLTESNAAITEFNIGVNKLLSLEGWRDIRIDQQNGYAYIVQREIGAKGKVIEKPVLNKDGTTFYIKQPEVVAALESTRKVSEELLGLHNLNREIRGQSKVEDLGFYLPPPDLRDKFISYIIDTSGKQRTSLLYAETASELKGLEVAWKEQIGANKPELNLITRGDQLKEFNIIHEYTEGSPYVSISNNQLRHGGSSAGAVVPGDARYINQIIAGYEGQIISSMRRYNTAYLNDIMQPLERMSELNQKYAKDQPGMGKGKNTDSARLVINTLNALGNSSQNATWKNINDVTDMMIRTVTKTIDNSVEGVFKKDTGSLAHFEQLDKDLKKWGIQNPWESYDLWQQSIRGGTTVDSKRLVSAANGMLGTFQLRLGDMAHNLVNVLSLPILTQGNLMAMLPKTELANGEKIAMPMKLLYDGVMHIHHPEGRRLGKYWEEKGLVSSAVRDYEDLNGLLHSPQTGKSATNQALEALERFKSSKAVEILTKPADWTEQMTRRASMHTGYLAAKTAYPGISDVGATIFASAFTDRAIGNYYAAQKPTMFQGTLGAAIGLYQTYMMTYAQHVYRSIEAGKFAALSQTMLAQAGIFGMSSLPGYSLLSEFIGKYMSNENYDLTTGTYRALPNSLAQIVLYGMPSWIGPSLYTRGDVSPRIPTVDNLALVNTATGIYNSLGKMLNTMASQPGIDGKLQGTLEALSLQTLSRPIARMAEIAAGESITQKGQTVSTSDDVWTFNGITSRLLSVRPIEEQNLRNALHLNSFYGHADREARDKAMNQIRVAIRAGNLTDALVDDVAMKYLRQGGSAKGWTAAMNEVMARTEEGTSYSLMKKLEPNSPLRRMIADTF